MANEASSMKTVYHVETGPHSMYEIDANNALGHHPTEFSATPWSVDDTNAFRQKRHEREVAEAQAAGRPEPVPPKDLVLSDAQQTELDAEGQARAEAAEIVAEADAMDKEKREWEAKVTAARALLATPLHPPVPALQGVSPIDPRTRDSVVIDDGWEDFSVPKQRALAMKLGAPNSVTAEQAKERIANEVKRRKEGVPKPAPVDPLDQHPSEVEAARAAAAEKARLDAQAAAPNKT